MVRWSSNVASRAGAGDALFEESDVLFAGVERTSGRKRDGLAAARRSAAVWEQ